MHIVGRFIAHRLVPPLLSVIQHLHSPKLISLIGPLLGWLAPKTRLPLYFLMLLQRLLLLPWGLVIDDDNVNDLHFGLFNLLR